HPALALSPYTPLFRSEVVAGHVGVQRSRALGRAAFDPVLPAGENVVVHREPTLRVALRDEQRVRRKARVVPDRQVPDLTQEDERSEEHTSELQSRENL